MSAGSDGKVWIWSTNSGDSIITLDTYSGPINTLALFDSDNAKILVTGSEDSRLTLWTRLEPSAQLLDLYYAFAPNFAMYPQQSDNGSGVELVAAIDSSVVHVIDAKTSQTRYKMPLNSADETMIAFKKDGKRFAHPQHRRTTAGILSRRRRPHLRRPTAATGTTMTQMKKENPVNNSLWLSITLAIMAALTTPTATHAADETAGTEGFPNQPITILIPRGQGGGSHQLSSRVATELAKKLGTTTRLVNKPGEYGKEALYYYNTQPPNGYTILQHVDDIASLYAKGETDINPTHDLTPLGIAQVTFSQLYIRETETRFNDPQIFHQLRQSPP